MATPAPSANPSVVTVERGDTLWGIASDYLGSGSKYKELASKNNISNPNLIYVGQKITLTGTGSSSTSTSTTSTKLKITAFGLSAANTSSNTLFAVWTCGREHIKNYKYEWQYTTGDQAEGEDVWFKGSSGDTTDAEETNSTYNIPSGAEKVQFRVKPISETKTTGTGSNQKTEPHWEGSWVGFDSARTYDANNVPPETPTKIDAEIDHKNMKLKVEISDYPVEDLIEDGLLSSTKIEVQVIANNKTLAKSTADLTFNTYGYASWECPVTEGNQYKVRCRVVRKSYKSAWSSYTDNVSSVPATPTDLSIKPIKNSATGTTDVYLEWKASNTAETYTIQYAGVVSGSEPDFDTSNNDAIKSITTTDDTTHYTLTNVNTGLVYYFRIAANLKEGSISSKWSSVTDGITIGTLPGPPTTWSSSTSAVIDEPLYLYWLHNPTDGSSETNAEIYIEIWKGEKLVHTIDKFQSKSTDYEERDQTSFYQFDTNLETNPYLEDGVKLRWRVQTAGVSGEFGNDPNKHWSIVREIDIYAPPELTFTVKPNGSDVAYNSDFTCTSFPLIVRAFAGPETQVPTSYYISIVSNEIYETVDNMGNNKTVGSGDIVYSKYFDNDTVIDEYEISAGDVNLDNSISYTIECVVSMNSGLSAKRSMVFTVEWDDEAYEPWAQVTFDSETYVAHIRPYCEEYTTHYYTVTQSGTRYLATTEPVAVAWGEPATTSRGKQIYTTTGEKVYSGIATDSEGNYLDDEFYYYEVKTGSLVEGITLSVYRREFDGRFTEIATGIDNTKNTFVTDPHPALDYARYRIVAMVDDTGAISYTDLPGVPIGEPGIIIQWDEEWSSFDVDPDITDSLSKPNWAGSLIRLPYNVDVSPSYGVDTTFIEYAGREHPVSYYGTQLGESATWSTTIPKSDKETIYALHRLAKWPGNVYAREPSGMGYWANVTVQFPQKHLDQTIPVSLTLTRVEGGM